MPLLRRYLPLFTVAFAIACFYLYDLSAVGMLGPDEPRYASIGHSMSQSGDFVTPRLWGSAWFEKPPLLYWMTAAATRLGLDPDLSARVPIALLSLCFLAASFDLLRREFGTDAAVVSTVLLATSAGWITFSSLCLTDLPLAVFFSLAVFASLPLVHNKDQGAKNQALRFVAIGVSIGLATLAKGLVPIALALPFAWFLRKEWRKWWIAAAACLFVAAPWYSLVYARNGYPFIEDFFLKHHVERLYSAVLQHVQPWYYYIPVFLAALFPWTPLLGLLSLRDQAWEERRRFLVAVVLFGLVFFSVSLNKLPGYLLPLMPSVFALLGAHFETKSSAAISRMWLLPCALLIAIVPLVAQVLPEILSEGRLKLVPIKGISATEAFYVILPVATLIVARRSWSGLLLALCAVAAGIYVKTIDYPLLDRQVSARRFWGELQARQVDICEIWLARDWSYGLAFYRGKPFPNCDSGHYQLGLRSVGHGPPLLEPLHH